MATGQGILLVFEGDETVGKHTKKRKLVDINVIIAAIAEEIKRIHDESTAPYAPTPGMYRRLRTPGVAPTIDKNLRRAGYGLTADEWKRFVSDHTDLEVEPLHIVQKRRTAAINKTLRRKRLGIDADEEHVSADNDTGNTSRWTTGVHQRGDLDTLPTEGMPVCRVSVANGERWCMLR